jgi:hypothetical protein
MRSEQDSGRLLVAVCDAAVVEAASKRGGAFAWDERHFFYPVAWAARDVLFVPVMPRRHLYLLSRAARWHRRYLRSRAARFGPGDGVVVPLPSSPEIKPWLYAEPEDADDYLNQLDIFIREEIDTAADEWAVQVEERGHRLFVVTPYGFERKNTAEHDRLMATVGPDGWHGSEAHFQSQC